MQDVGRLDRWVKAQGSRCTSCGMAGHTEIVLWLRLGGGRRVDDGRSEWSAIRDAGRLGAMAPVSWSGGPVDRGGRGGSRAPQEHARAHQGGGDDQPG